MTLKRENISDDIKKKQTKMGICLENYDEIKLYIELFSYVMRRYALKNIELNLDN